MIEGPPGRKEKAAEAAAKKEEEERRRLEEEKKKEVGQHKFFSYPYHESTYTVDTKMCLWVWTIE